MGVPIWVLGENNAAEHFIWNIPLYTMLCSLYCYMNENVFFALSISAFHPFYFSSSPPVDRIESNYLHFIYSYTYMISSRLIKSLCTVFVQNLKIKRLLFTSIYLPSRRLTFFYYWYAYICKISWYTFETWHNLLELYKLTFCPSTPHQQCWAGGKVLFVELIQILMHVIRRIWYMAKCIPVCLY